MQVAVGIDGTANGKYIGTMSGTKEELLDAISDVSSWAVGTGVPSEFGNSFMVNEREEPCIAIVRIQAKTNQIEYVRLDSGIIPSATTLSFTDYGWKKGGGFKTDEGNDSFVVDTNPAAAAGEVKTITISKLNSNGDQVFAFLGPNTDPQFLYGINFGTDVTGWQDDATDDKTSSLPSDLIGNDTSVGTIDGKNNNNYRYIGNMSGAKEELLASINNSDNWQRSGEDLPSRGTFTVLSAKI